MTRHEVKEMAVNQLKAGFGKGELRFPRELFPIEGFIGVHDDPCVRLMVLESGGVKVCIAALEMVNVAPRGIELTKTIIEKKTGTPGEHIWVHVTHAITTMHEPGPMGPPDHRPPETEDDRRKKELYYAVLEKAVSAAASEAANSFGEAKLGWGTGSCGVNINRDVETPFGWWTGLNPDGPSNKTMTVLRVEDLNGALKGLFISYGLKPCAIDMSGMRTQDRLVSSDVAGACCRMLEERFAVPALFCCSAAGDQVPRELSFLEEVTPEGQAVPRDAGVAAGLEIAARLGAEMGRDAAAIAESILCEETQPRLAHSRVSFQWERIAEGPRRRRGPAAPVKEYPAGGPCDVEAEIITLGNAAFVAEKPEVNCRTELELSAKSPYAHTCLICMVNGGMKYMPDLSAYERNTFEAQSSMLMPGAAERFVETVSAALTEQYSHGE